MMVLVASLAWAAQMEPEPDVTHPIHDTGGVVLSAVGGGVLGAFVGGIAGAGIGAAATKNVECDTTEGDCGSMAVAYMYGGVVVGVVAGATIGGVVAANSMRHHRKVVWIPVGPGGPGAMIAVSF